MPRICRHGLPPRLLDHLLDRVAYRNISADQLGLLADRLSTEPEVPRGRWFKRFPGMAVCGEGEFIRTFLRPGQIATGEDLNLPLRRQGSGNSEAVSWSQRGRLQPRSR